MQEIKIAKESFLKNFMIPLSRITDRAKVKLSNDKVSVIIFNDKANYLFFSTCELEEKIPSDIVWDIPSVIRLIKLLGCIDEDIITFKYDNNHIKYDSGNIRFKYHFLAEGIIKNLPVPKNFDSMVYDISIPTSKDILTDIIKVSTFANFDVNKCYFTFKPDGVYVKIVDYNQPGTDESEIKISNYIPSTIPNDIAFKFEMLKDFKGVNCDDLRINITTTDKIIRFDAINGKNTYQFISSILK